MPTNIFWYSPSWSSILSHSSKMKCLIPFKLRLFSLISAKILPGVPTTMCGQLSFNVVWSFLMLMPPKNTLVRIPSKYFENRSYSLYIWNANSLVWHNTRTLTVPSTGSSCCSVANTNTAVFPIPLFAWHMTSMPRILCGIHSCCTKLKTHVK